MPRARQPCSRFKKNKTKIFEEIEHTEDLYNNLFLIFSMDKNQNTITTTQLKLSIINPAATLLDNSTCYWKSLKKIDFFFHRVLLKKYKQTADDLSVCLEITLLTRSFLITITTLFATKRCLLYDIKLRTNYVIYNYLIMYLITKKDDCQSPKNWTIYGDLKKTSTILLI